MPYNQILKDAQQRYLEKNKDNEDYKLKVSLRNRQNYLRRKEKGLTKNKNSTNNNNEIVVNKIDSIEIIEPVKKDSIEIIEPVNKDSNNSIEIIEPVKEDIKPIEQVKEDIKPVNKDSNNSIEINPDIEQIKNNVVNSIINYEDNEKKIINKLEQGYTPEDILKDNEIKTIIKEDLENENNYNLNDLTPEEKNTVKSIIQEITAYKLNRETDKRKQEKNNLLGKTEIKFEEDKPIPPINKPYKLSNTNNKDLDKFKHKRTLRRIIQTLKPKSLKNIQRIFL